MMRHEDNLALRETLDNADRVLQHMSATMTFAEEAIDQMDNQPDEFKYPMHLIALLRGATNDVRALLDDGMCILNLQAAKQTQEG